jgi:hypothetical protein
MTWKHMKNDKSHGERAETWWSRLSTITRKEKEKEEVNNNKKKSKSMQVRCPGCVTHSRHTKYE